MIFTPEQRKSRFKHFLKITNGLVPKERICGLLEKSQLAGIPVLVLGNKKDLPNALDEKELVERLNLASIQDREI